jgi:hypothetical protein
LWRRATFGSLQPELLIHGRECRYWMLGEEDSFRVPRNDGRVYFGRRCQSLPCPSHPDSQHLSHAPEPWHQIPRTHTQSSVHTKTAPPHLPGPPTPGKRPCNLPAGSMLAHLGPLTGLGASRCNNAGTLTAAVSAHITSGLVTLDPFQCSSLPFLDHTTVASNAFWSFPKFSFSLDSVRRSGDC